MKYDSSQGRCEQLATTFRLNYVNIWYFNGISN